MVYDFRGGAENSSISNSGKFQLKIPLIICLMENLLFTIGSKIRAVQRGARGEVARFASCCNYWRQAADCLICCLDIDYVWINGTTRRRFCMVLVDSLLFFWAIPGIAQPLQAAEQAQEWCGWGCESIVDEGLFIFLSRRDTDQRTDQPASSEKVDPHYRIKEICYYTPVSWDCTIHSCSDATTLIALQSRLISQTYILDWTSSIALLPANLHGRSSTCCLGSGSLQVRVGLM